MIQNRLNKFFETIQDKNVSKRFFEKDEFLRKSFLKNEITQAEIKLLLSVFLVDNYIIIIDSINRTDLNIWNKKINELAIILNMCITEITSISTQIKINETKFIKKYKYGIPL